MSRRKSHELLTNPIQSLFPVATMLGVSDDAELLVRVLKKHPTTQKEGQGKRERAAKTQPTRHVSATLLLFITH